MSVTFLPYIHTFIWYVIRYLSLKPIYRAPFSSQDCISLGSGEPNTSEYRSFVLYHNNGPRWSEMVKLPIPIDRFRGSHLRFEFRHCSSESVMQPSGSHPSVHEFIRTDWLYKYGLCCVDTVWWHMISWCASFQLKTKERKNCLVSPSLLWWEKMGPHCQMRVMSSMCTRYV